MIMVMTHLKVGAFMSNSDKISSNTSSGKGFRHISRKGFH